MGGLLAFVAMSLPDGDSQISLIHRLCHDREMTREFGENWRELDFDELDELSKNCPCVSGLKGGLIMDVSYCKATLDGDENYIVIEADKLNEEEIYDIETRDGVELFHFTNPFAFTSAFRMCDLLTCSLPRMEKLHMKTGTMFVDYETGEPSPAIFFKAENSARCYLYVFATKEDFETACNLATRFWEITHSDEIADSDAAE